MEIQFNGVHLAIIMIVGISAFVCGVVAGYVYRDEKDDFVDIDMAEDAE